MRVLSTVLLVSLLAGCPADGSRGDGSRPGDPTAVDPKGGSPNGNGSGQNGGQVDPRANVDLDGVSARDDCDDENPTVYPGAEEIPYDGIDQDCAGGDLVDVDEDGADALEVGGDDCDDKDPARYPEAEDIPYDGIDQNCRDGDLVDADGDGVIAVEVGGVDCDDRDPLAAPGMPDTVGDGVDQSCDGLDGTDVDLDGYASDLGGGDDCDDLNPLVNPGAVETWYDGVDQNCDAACDGDQDGDGSVLDGWTVVDGDACDADTGASRVLAPTDCDDTDPLAEALLVSTTPASGSTDANPWRQVRATLYEYDPSGVLVLLDDDGDVVPGTSSWSASTLVFTPDRSLDELEVYTAELTWGCGTEVWSFTTNDGTGQDFLHEWTFGPPDQLLIDIVNPVASVYGFGMAETASGAVGWYGEDCAGALATGSCHQMMNTTTLLLESVYPSVGAVVPGSTTLFEATADPRITYYIEARDGPERGSCWTWGHDPSYFSWCSAP